QGTAPASPQQHGNASSDGTSTPAKPAAANAAATSNSSSTTASASQKAAPTTTTTSKSSARSPVTTRRPRLKRSEDESAGRVASQHDHIQGSSDAADHEPEGWGDPPPPPPAK